MLEQSYNFLVAEDDIDDRLLMEVALNEKISKYDSTTFFENGAELVNFLNDGKEVQNQTVVIVDLNMPVMNGKEVIRYIKSNNRLKHIPVIAFTTSQSEEDISYCYEQGANAFLVKPSSYNIMEDTIENMVEFWKTVRLS